MGIADISIVKGWPATVETLGRWAARPFRTLAPWLLVSALIAAALLGLTWLVAAASPPDPTYPDVMPANVAERPDFYFAHYVRSNMLVLALHTMACLGGYVTNTALTDPADGDSELLEQVTRRVGLAALVFVPFATLFSIGTQSWILGSRASTLTEHLHLPLGTFLATVAPHAMVELTAIFLPLAAWLVLSRRGRWNELLAATLVTFVLATPTIAAAAWVEANTWPDRVKHAQETHPDFEGTFLGDLEAAPNAWQDRATRDGLVVSLRVGPRTEAEPFPTLEAAVAHAKGATSSGPAIIVVETRIGFIEHELVASQRGPGIAPVTRGEPAVTTPMRLEQVGASRIASMQAGSAAQLGVRAIVQGARVLTAAELGWSVAQEQADRERRDREFFGRARTGTITYPDGTTGTF